MSKGLFLFFIHFLISQNVANGMHAVGYSREGSRKEGYNQLPIIRKGKKAWVAALSTVCFRTEKTNCLHSGTQPISN